MMVLDLFAIVGIGLEIWGFFWILKYNRMQRISDLHNWALKHGYSENWIGEIPREHEMILENDLSDEIIATEKRGGQVWDIPKEFYDYSENRRKWSIGLVVIGLCGQMIQVIGSNLFPS